MSTTQYLERHAEAESASAGLIEGSFEHVVVVPVHDEAPEFIDNLDALRGQHALAIVVVNSTESSSVDTHRSNAAVIATIGGTRLGDDGCHLYVRDIGGLHVVAVDRTTAGRWLPEGQGVGLARRIGCDIALALRARGRLASRWIHTTDADVVVPSDYFECVSGDPGVAALSYPFEHDCSAATPLSEALCWYEAKLRYYVRALAWAGSPYAFHTIGSTMAVTADAYARVRGIPKRLAAEDFYLLNKVAKIGAVATPTCRPLRIAARSSSRVPFGTGPATAAIAAELASGRAPATYAPASFELLRQWLQFLDGFSDDPNIDSFDDFLADSVPPLRASVDNQRVRDGLVGTSKGATTAAGRRKRLSDWFDGFRTLKFIHAVRDAGHGVMPMTEAIATAPFIASGAPTDDPRELRRFLANLESTRR